MMTCAACKEEFKEVLDLVALNTDVVIFGYANLCKGCQDLLFPSPYADSDDLEEVLSAAFQLKSPTSVMNTHEK